MKRAACFVAILAGLCAAGTVFAGGGAQRDEGGRRKVVLKLGDTWSATHPMAQAVDRVFKPQVEGQTDGAVTVEVYHSGVADQQRIITAIQPTLNKLYAENAWARTLTDKVKAVH